LYIASSPKSGVRAARGWRVGPGFSAPATTAGVPRPLARRTAQESRHRAVQAWHPDSNSTLRLYSPWAVDGWLVAVARAPCTSRCCTQQSLMCMMCVTCSVSGCPVCSEFRVFSSLQQQTDLALKATPSVSGCPLERISQMSALSGVSLTRKNIRKNKAHPPSSGIVCT
jgi:hypothetical protein